MKEKFKKEKCSNCDIQCVEIYYDKRLKYKDKCYAEYLEKKFEQAEDKIKKCCLSMENATKIINKGCEAIEQLKKENKELKECFNCDNALCNEMNINCRIKEKYTDEENK